MRLAAGHSEDGDDERLRHQRWPYPYDFATAAMIRLTPVFFVFVTLSFFLLIEFVFVITASVAFANSLVHRVLA